MEKVIAIVITLLLAACKPAAENAAAPPAPPPAAEAADLVIRDARVYTLNPAVAPANPTFGANEVPNYTASINERIRFRNQVRTNANPRYKLWPIPQFEVDANPDGMKQNKDW